MPCLYTDLLCPGKAIRVCLPCVKDLFAGRDVSVIGEWMCKVPLGHCPFFCVVLNLGLKPPHGILTFCLYSFLFPCLPGVTETLWQGILSPLSSLASLFQEKKKISKWLESSSVCSGFCIRPSVCWLWLHKARLRDLKMKSNIRRSTFLSYVQSQIKTLINKEEGPSTSSWRWRLETISALVQALSHRIDAVFGFSRFWPLQSLPTEHS